MRQDYTIPKLTKNKLPLETHHLGVPSGASKRLSEPMVRLAPTVHLSCTDTNSLQTERNEIPYDPVHLGAPSGASKMISEPMVRLAKPCTYLALTLTTSPNGPNEIPHDPRHLGVPSGASKMISEPMVRSAQTVHRSCVKISTISKRTETSFHLSFVT